MYLAGSVGEYDDTSGEEKGDGISVGKGGRWRNVERGCHSGWSD